MADRKVSLLTVLKYIVLILLDKLLSPLLMRTRLVFRLAGPSDQPSLTKSYSCRPNLRNRVFIPKGGSSATFPVYFNVHGGGFSMFEPLMDDEFCSYLSQKFNILVVSLNYRKAPIYAFPTPVLDLCAIATAVLNDKSLPLDASRVAAGGWSAGANLAFAMSMCEGLKERVRGVAAFYGIFDFTKTTGEKLADADDPEGRGFETWSKGVVERVGWTYVPKEEMDNPLASVGLAKREALPDKAYIVGCELDILRHEGLVMAEKMAGLDRGERGRERIDGVKEGYGWRQGGITWECLKGFGHGANVQNMSGEKEVQRKKMADGLYDRVGQWLVRDVYA